MAISQSSPASASPKQRGFTLIELLIAMTILLIVSGTVMGGLMQMSYTQGTITNRSEMHASVRSATELMQQEIGQAGRVAVPVGTTYTLAAAVPAANAGLSTTVTLNSSTGSFPGLYDTGSATKDEWLVVGAGGDQESVMISAYNSTTHQITAVFNNVDTTTGLTQVSGAPVLVMGTFSSGIVPTTMTNGSTGSLLKLYGDINGDGSMVYIEYKCDTAAGKLYRNAMAYDAASKPALTDSMVLLNNILPNPDGSPCFSYQQKRVGALTDGTNDYVVDVSVTLTVQTQQQDPKTHQYQQETKALLNVSPRNVFESWQLASADITSRIQPMPPTVTALLP